MLGYTSWHQLIVYSCISCLLSADLLMLLLFSYLSVISLSCYLFIFCLQFIILWYMYTLFICTSTFSFSYTLTGSSDNSGFARPDIGCIHFIFQVFDELVASRGVWSFPLLILVFLSSFHSCFCTFLDFCILDLVFTLILYLYDIMRICLYVILQWSLIYYSSDL